MYGAFDLPPLKCPWEMHEDSVTSQKQSGEEKKFGKLYNFDYRERIS